MVRSCVFYCEKLCFMVRSCVLWSEVVFYGPAEMWPTIKPTMLALNYLQTVDVQQL